MKLTKIPEPNNNSTSISKIPDLSTSTASEILLSIPNIPRICGKSTSPFCNEMKVKIVKWNAVATWRWDIPDDDVCGICQVHFDGTCPTCKYPGDDCSLRMCLSIFSGASLTSFFSLRQMRSQFPHGEQEQRISRFLT